MPQSSLRQASPFAACDFMALRSALRGALGVPTRAAAGQRLALRIPDE